MIRVNGDEIRAAVDEIAEPGTVIVSFIAKQDCELVKDGGLALRVLPGDDVVLQEERP